MPAVHTDLANVQDAVYGNKICSVPKIHWHHNGRATNGKFILQFLRCYFFSILRTLEEQFVIEEGKQVSRPAGHGHWVSVNMCSVSKCRNTRLEINETNIHFGAYGAKESVISGLMSCSIRMNRLVSWRGPLVPQERLSILASDAKRWWDSRRKDDADSVQQ